MNCSSCNQPLNEGATFCGNCGAQVFSAQQVAAPQPVRIAQPQTPQPQQVPLPVQTAAEPQPQQMQQQFVQSAVNVLQAPAIAPTAPQPAYAMPAGPQYAPQQLGAPARQGGGKAIAALVLGILCILFALLIPIMGLILAVLAIIFGSLTIKTNMRGFALTGLIAGSAGILLSIIMTVVYGIVLSSGSNSTSIISLIQFL